MRGDSSSHLLHQMKMKVFWTSSSHTCHVEEWPKLQHKACNPCIFPHTLVGLIPTPFSLASLFLISTNQNNSTSVSGSDQENKIGVGGKQTCSKSGSKTLMAKHGIGEKKQRMFALICWFSHIPSYLACLQSIHLPEMGRSKARE